MRLGEVAKAFSGYAFKSISFADSGIPVIKIKNIKLGYINLTDVQYVDEAFLSIDEKFHVKAGDILISLTGSHLTQPGSVVGRIAIHSQSNGLCLLNQRAGKIVVTDQNRCDPKYLFFRLTTEESRYSIASMAYGAANQANISPSQVESLEISLPPLITQQKISSILSAYDDLIENNTRRIKILEEMAQRIYREWFVHFRFPGHENMKMVESELELIPEGWDVKRLEELVENKKFSIVDGPFGTQLHSNEYTTKGIPVVRVINLSYEGHFIDDDLVYITEEKFQTLIRSAIYPDDILLAKTGATIGKLALFPSKLGKGLITSSVLKISPDKKKYNTFYIYNFIKNLSDKKYWEKISLGTTRPSLTLSDVKDIKLLEPPNEIVKTFHSMVEPFYDSLQNLELKNKTLRQTRDLLLPKLVSGKIDVSNLDIDVGAIDA